MLTFHCLTGARYGVTLDPRRPEKRDIFRACGFSANKRGYNPVRVPETADRLIVWGLGNSETVEIARRSIKNKHHVISWDLGYWRRNGGSESKGFRLSIDAMHPDKFIMKRNRSSERWDSLGIKLREEWDPEGHIVLVGMGRKSATMYGEEIGHWEQITSEAIRFRWPKAKIVFRPKPGHILHCSSVPGIESVPNIPIEDVIRGARLVVCRHSNVAVDAMIAGIPVVTYGGAAAAVYSNSLMDDHVPLEDWLRRQFLANLAWFEWTMPEMRKGRMWDVFEEMISDSSL